MIALAAGDNRLAVMALDCRNLRRNTIRHFVSLHQAGDYINLSQSQERNMILTSLQIIKSVFAARSTERKLVDRTSCHVNRQTCTAYTRRVCISNGDVAERKARAQMRRFSPGFQELVIKGRVPV